MSYDLRKEVRVALYSRGISVTQMASELGMTRAHLSRILNGHTEGRLEIWEKLAARVGKRLELVEAPAASERNA